MPQQLVNAGWAGTEPRDGHPLPLRNLAYPCGGEQAMDAYVLHACVQLPTYRLTVSVRFANAVCTHDAALCGTDTSRCRK